MGTDALRLAPRNRLATAFRLSTLRIDLSTAERLVEGGGLLVDVRRQDDPSPFVDGAVRIAPDEIPSRLDELPRDRAVILACT
jgi:rhodanese-related sulfurtransferase